MPIYEYKCKECNKIIEIVHTIDYNSGIQCKDCNAECTKLISVSSFVVHGFNAKNNYSINSSNNKA